MFEQAKKKFNYRADGAPREIYNRTLFYGIILFGIMGAARGIDEGAGNSISTLPSSRKLFGFTDPHKTNQEITNLQSNISSMVQLGSIGGCLVGMFAVDKLGRKNALKELTIVWIVGVIIQMTSSTVGQLYAGRLIEGFAVGQTVCCGPVYISEVTPKAIRGLCTCFFSGSVYLGTTLAYFAVYSAAVNVSNTSRLQWCSPLIVKLCFAVVLHVGAWFVIESPRWLVKKGRDEQAVHNMSRLRNLPEDHPYVLSEVSDIQEALRRETEHSTTSTWKIVSEFFTRSSMRYRLFVCIMIQLLSQFTLTGAFSVYIANITNLVGFQGNRALLMSCVLGIVKMISAYIGAFVFIDTIGRRRSMFLGLSIQFFTLIFFATFLMIVPRAGDKTYKFTNSQYHAAQAALAAIYLNGTGWTIGWNAIQYLINSEIFPLRSRNIATAIAMVFHFASQYASTEALPHMLLALPKGGVFYFAAGIVFLGMCFIFFFVPEVSGRSLESMEEVFDLPWYKIGRFGGNVVDKSEICDVKEDQYGNTMIVAPDANFFEDKAQAQHYEGRGYEGVNKTDDSSIEVLAKV